MSRLSGTTVPLLALTLFLAVGLEAPAQELPVPKHAGDGPLRFLAAQPGWIAYALDSAFDPTGFVGVLDPPYEPGENLLAVLSRRGGDPRVARTLRLGDQGFVLSFALSPDGDTALVGRHAPEEVLVVRGLRLGRPHVAEAIPLATAPLSFAFAPDGTFAVVGNQTGPGEASLTVVAGLPGAVRVAGAVGLGIEAQVLGAVESVDFSHDGRRLLVHTALHDDPAPPGFLMPRVVLQVVRGLDPGAPGPGPDVSEPLLLPRESALPPEPAFAGLPTGVALGDSALLCDGDSAIVPVSGALDLGQPDARIFLVRGLEAGRPEIARTLSPADGLGVAPLQVALAPDCSRAVVTNVFTGDASLLTGLGDPTFASVEVTALSLGFPFPAEPAIAPGGDTLWVHHPRIPLDGVPPAAVTVFDLAGPGQAALTPAGPPVMGPVRAWLQAKDRTLAAHPPSLVNYVMAFTEGLAIQVRRSLYRDVRAAIVLSEVRGLEGVAAHFLDRFLDKVARFEGEGKLTAVEARVLTDLAGVGLRRLES